MDIEATVIVNSIYSVSEMDYTFEVSFKLVSRESVRARATSFFLFPELFSPALLCIFLILEQLLALLLCRCSAGTTRPSCANATVRKTPSFFEWFP
eukprot:COSAG06_NODE_1750_length_8437_cov_11.374373_1_plen_96_part_00